MWIINIYKDQALTKHDSSQSKADYMDSQYVKGPG